MAKSLNFERRAGMMNKKVISQLRTLLTGFLTLLLAYAVCAQITFDTSFSANKLVDTFLLGQGMRVGNISFTGPHSSIGYFKADNNAIGVESGILLSTGKVQDAN